MKKLSLSKRIEVYLQKQDCWIHSGEIERLALEAGYKASNSGRRCREMQNEGILDRKEEKGSVLYRFHKEETPQPKREVRFINNVPTLFA